MGAVKSKKAESPIKQGLNEATKKINAAKNVSKLTKQDILKTNCLLDNKRFEIKKSRKKKYNALTIKITNSVSMDDHDTTSYSINNGVIGVFIHQKIGQVLYDFWVKHLDSKSRTEQLEIGCAVYFRMITDKGNVRKKLKGQVLEVVGLRFYDMMSWLIMHAIMNNSINLYNTLKNIGAKHRNNIGAKKEDFKIYLNAFHETLAEYFPESYEIDVKFSFEQVFCIATQIMCNESKNLKKIDDIDHQKQHNSGYYSDPFGIDTKLNEIKNGEFLNSYDKCLLSKIGREYLFRYLGQTLCYEYVIFLTLAYKYYNEDNDKGKFMIARIIQNKCLTNGATFEINVSYECYKNFESDMNELSTQFATNKTNFAITKDILSPSKREIDKIIKTQRWKGFQRSISSFFNVNTNL